MNLWIVIIVAGVITYAIRLSMIVLSDRLTLPDWLQQALRYVPVAVLCAIIFPELFPAGETINWPFTNFRLVAGIAAGIVAYVTKNVMWTVLVGLGVLWGLQAIFF